MGVEVSDDQITYQSVLETRVNDEAIARYGVARKDLLRHIEAVGGIRVGEKSARGNAGSHWWSSSPSDTATTQRP